MQINKNYPVGAAGFPARHEDAAHPQGTSAAKTTAQDDGTLALLRLGLDDKDKKKNPYAVTESKNSFNVKTSKPKDSAPQLTKRLVNATGQFEVRQVISQAGGSLVQLRLIAAVSKGADANLARAYIQKLERLMSRATVKLRELDAEDTIKFDKAKAERQKQDKKAEELKTELRKRYTARKIKENRYLTESVNEKAAESLQQAQAAPSCDGKLDAAAEAQIAIQAEAVAASDVSAGTASADAGLSAESGGAEGSGESVSI